MLALVRPLEDEVVSLPTALGRVLADAVVAMRDQPPFHTSAMDGYAVRSGDTPGQLRIGGESSAGHGFEGRVEPGIAIRISTGAITGSTGSTASTRCSSAMTSPSRSG